MAASHNPLDLARETLRTLAARKLAPTPENYQRIYRQLAGASAEGEVGVEENLARIFEEVAHGSPRLAPRLTLLARSIEARDWDAFQNALAAMAEAEAAETPDWATLIRELLRQWDLKQTGLTSARKREALERVLINFGRDSRDLHAKLTALVAAWAAGTAAPPDLASPAPAGEAEVPSAYPIALLDREDAIALAGELVAQCLRQGVAPHLGHVPDLRDEAEKLASLAQGTRDAQSLDSLARALRQFWFRVELRGQGTAEILEGLKRLLKLLIANIGELAADDRWLKGQLAVVQDLLERPLDARSVQDAERGLKDVLFKQGTLKHSLEEAKATLKNLVALFITRIGEVSESAGGFGKKIERYTEMLSATEDLPSLNRILKDLLADTRSLHLDMVRSHDELVAARRQAEEAERRVKQMEAELAQVSELVHQDFLTGTLNRRGLEEAFAREFARAERHGQPISIALLDIDHFKRLNDTYGHEAGDQALQHLTRVIRDILRPTDVVARYGGEEFVIIFPDTPAEVAVGIMTRLQRELTKRFFLHDARRILVTFSAGVAQRQPGESPEELIARADAALYRAKQAGRNRVFAA